jgi:uncharacterized protein YjdB
VKNKYINKIIISKTMKRYLKMLATVWIVAILSVSCGQKDEDPVIEVTSITVTPSAITVKVGEKQTLTATVEPGNAADKTVTWSSSDPAIAEVNVSNGEITAKAIGTANIIATAANGKTAACAVTVAETVIEVNSVSISPDILDLESGEKQTLTAIIDPLNATDQTVVWSSSDTTIAGVDVSTGEVTARAAGTANITVTAANGKTATCAVRVTIEVNSVSVSPDMLDLEPGEKQTLTATVDPLNATDQTVVWSSSDPAIAEVDASTGEVTAKAYGTANIIATAGGKTDTCEITIREITVLGELVQEGEILIIAYGGGPHEELKSTGFDIYWTWGWSIAEITEEMDRAHNAGLKLFVYYDYINTNTEVAVNAFKGHPGFGGYVLADEPPVQDFEYWDQLVRKIQELDTEHYCYVNLFPNYANARQLGTTSYTEYLETYAKLPTGFMSFDLYPTDGRGNVYGNWYLNMEHVRNVTNKYGIPFWAYISSTRGSADDPEFTLGELSLMVYTNLAYGSQAIQYFVFSGSSTASYKYFHTPINDGQRTSAYDHVSKLNHEVKRLSHIFSKSKVLNVWHTGSVPNGTVRLRQENPPEMPPIKLLKTSSGALVSLIEKDNNHYMIIVNHDYLNPMTLTLNVDWNVVRKVLKDGSITNMRSETIEIAPGDAAIYMWEKQI